MYQTNKGLFKQTFNALYPEIKGKATADFWHERLTYTQQQATKSLVINLIAVVLAALTAGIIAKLPAILYLDPELFYTRNIGFIVLPILTAYFGWKNRLALRTWVVLLVATLAGLVFINVLPVNVKSDTILLSCIHLPLFLWALLGVAFVGGPGHKVENRLAFLHYNGDLLVMSALITIAGLLMTGLTVGLFKLTGLNIEKFYFEYVAIFGLAAIPIVGTYLTQTSPQLVGKISPVIAQLFAPFVLIMLSIYLGAIVYSGETFYKNRELLMIFNALLVGVMALIFFSLAALTNQTNRRFGLWVLLLLSLVTIAVNCMALTAVVQRIMVWEISPNKLATIGINLLIFSHLIIILYGLIRVIGFNYHLQYVGKLVAYFFRYTLFGLF